MIDWTTRLGPDISHRFSVENSTKISPSHPRPRSCLSVAVAPLAQRRRHGAQVPWMRRHEPTAPGRNCHKLCAGRGHDGARRAASDG
jgi:hypothetical protein